MIDSAVKCESLQASFRSLCATFWLLSQFSVQSKVSFRRCCNIDLIQWFRVVNATRIDIYGIDSGMALYEAGVAVPARCRTLNAGTLALIGVEIEPQQPAHE